MGLITQAAAVQRVGEIQTAATRTLQQTTNSFGSIMVDLADFTANIQPNAGFDAETTAEIDGLKSALIGGAITTLEGMLAQLQGL